MVRIGLGYVKGVREEEMASLVTDASTPAPTGASPRLASRSGASREGLERLAWAGALDGLAPGSEEPGERRREDYWRSGVLAGAKAAGPGRQLALALDPPPAPELSPLGRWQRVIEDYRSTGVNLGEHPLALLREQLGEGVARSSDLERIADGATVEIAGMVVARQRPETAKGITFMLLEDECGTANLIVPSAVYERRRALVRAAPLLRASGRLERREGAVNVIVAELWTLRWDGPSEALAELRAVAPTGHSFGRRGR